MPASPKRRWFQFKLRTLLVGVVLLSIPCTSSAHEIRIVRARANWLGQHDWTLDEEYWDARKVQPEAQPWYRRVFGDISVAYLKAHNPAESRTAKELFPEADVELFTGH